jgi:hypothetical protein
MQAATREARKFSNYSESDWVVHEEHLPAQPGGFDWTCPPPTATHKLQLSEYQSRLRKVLPFRSPLLHVPRRLLVSIALQTLDLYGGKCLRSVEVDWIFSHHRMGANA